ncbi:hypothetical protein [Herbiconiux solani]|uniref:hypothetical protein n=1 Tax=Herbiconiux solani TaxID=661329 RepID=UPI000824D5CC|nr:hypothetical protein [Herbiconiux solani]
MTDETTTWPTIGAFADSVDRALTEVRAVLTVEDYLAMGIDEESAEVMASQAAREAANGTPDARESIRAAIDAVEAAVASRECTLSGRWNCSLPAGHDPEVQPCVKTCVNHFWKRTGESDEVCGIEPALAKFGHLCGPCFGRARRQLRDLIEVLPFIRSQVQPSMESARGPRVSGTREAPIPLNAQAVEDSHDLFQRVNEWMAQFDESLGLGASLVMLTWYRRSGERLPDFWADEYAARLVMTDLAAWYETHERRIVSGLPPLTVKAWTEDIADIGREFRGRYKLTAPRERVVSPRRCPECEEYAVAAEVGLGHQLYVWCQHCGTVIDAAEHAPDFKAAERAATVTISLPCEQGKHKQCGWAECPCDCHHEHRAA